MYHGMTISSDTINDGGGSGEFGTHENNSIDVPCRDQVEQTRAAAELVLHGIPSEEPCREGLRETPLRFAKAFRDLTLGYSMTAEEEAGGAIFQEAEEKMVHVKDIPVYSLCEHHLLPFFGSVHIAYIPNPDVGIIGLSKFSRIVDVFAKRLQVQERLTTEIADAFLELLKPKGVAVILQCRHMCMEMRGVCRQGTQTTTTDKRGVFCDPVVFQEFCSLLLLPSASTGNKFEYNLGSDKESLPECCSGKSAESEGCHGIRRSAYGTERIHHVSQDEPMKDCDIYRVYLDCAKNESDTIAKLVQDAVAGPLTYNKAGLSLLDIGAGTGAVLGRLCSTDNQLALSRYTAFEMDNDLCQALRSNVFGLGFDHQSAKISGHPFTIRTTPEEVGGCHDIVLLSHCLYGSKDKHSLLEHAMKFVARGGVILIVHRWKAGGTIDAIHERLSSKSILYHTSFFESTLEIPSLTARQRSGLQRYTNGDVSLDDEQTSTTRLMACITIEPHACILQGSERRSANLEEARGRVGYLARRKVPACVIKPNTATGIQACLQAASSKGVGNGKVTVIGGGHSENSFANDAIAINMGLWNQVKVDPNRRLVTVGGGATSGEVSKACEKYGFVAILGDRPGVGAGLVLQGGLNHFMRKFGLAIDNVVKVVYVSPQGGIFKASSDEELFVFRGAGSNFGVVLELTLRIHRFERVTAQDIIYDLPSPSRLDVIAKYSAAGESLPDTNSLDGFLFWSGADQLSFATTQFNLLGPNEVDSTGKMIKLPGQAMRPLDEPFTTDAPTSLYDQELYMKAPFAKEKVLTKGQSPPRKLRSNKRCLLLPHLAGVHEAILSEMMKTAPTKWCYIHFLHGGEAVLRVPPSTSAFGCRDWMFAAVITARWADDDNEREQQCMAWLERSTESLLPHSKGVYGSDLSPNDYHLARHAFGLNSFRLSSLKRQADPLNVIGCACPLLDHNQDPRLTARGVVVLFCGRRCSGKDWLASIVATELKRLMDEAVSDERLVSLARISDETKRAFAEANPPASAEKLIYDRAYKEKYRMALGSFYQEKRARDGTYSAMCYLRSVRAADAGSILLLTGMRDGIDYARRLAGRHVVFVKVSASDSAKRSRGWSHDKAIDESNGENAVDSKPDAFWDLIYANNEESTPPPAAKWVQDVLAPVILKKCTRSIPDIPQRGIQYRDPTTLLLQPFALPLWTGLVLSWLGSSRDRIDVVITPEALGYVFAGAVASALKKPLVLVRKQGKLEGDTNSIAYSGSNMHKLKPGTSSDRCSFEMVAGAVVPGQKVLIVDDCLARGATVSAMLGLVQQQGGVVSKVAILMELPDLSGRPQNKDVDVFSVMQFPGQ